MWHQLVLLLKHDGSDDVERGVSKTSDAGDKQAV
jgi:hypothetical protein